MARHTDKQIAKALSDCKGMVYVAAARLGCSPNTIKARLLKSNALREAVQIARGTTGDTAELKLFQAIQNGESWAIQFYLKTQCRDRGYSDKLEVDIILRRRRAIAALQEYMERTGKSEPEAIIALESQIPQISELIH